MKSEINEKIKMIINGEVPLNYKQIQNGIIPMDWEELTIGDVVSFEGGAQPPRTEFIFKPKDGYVRLIQIRDYKTDEYQTFIPRKLVRKFCDQDDIMIGRYGPPIFQILRGIEGAYNVALIKAIPRTDKINRDYLYYYLNIESLFKLIDKLSRRTSGQTGIDIEALNNFGLPLPNKNEQQKIASILSTWDIAMELKEKLIKQKKLQKKALMENLLTGKVRIPGFDGEWAIKKAGDLFNNYSNKTHSGIGEILSSTQDKGIIPRKNLDIDIKYSLESVSSYKKVNIGDFIISLRSFQGGIEYSDYEGLVSPAYTVLKSKIDIEDGFYKEYFKSINFIKRLNSMIYGIRDGKQIGYVDFSLLLLPYPPIEEQKRISQILNICENEICLLQKDLNENKFQKKGLMQLLLTGKVRVSC